MPFQHLGAHAQLTQGNEKTQLENLPIPEGRLAWVQAGVDGPSAGGPCHSELTPVSHPTASAHCCGCGASASSHLRPSTSPALHLLSATHMHVIVCCMYLSLDLVLTSKCYEWMNESNDCYRICSAADITAAGAATKAADAYKTMFCWFELA